MASRLGVALFLVVLLGALVAPAEAAPVPRQPRVTWEPRAKALSLEPGVPRIELVTFRVSTRVADARAVVHTTNGSALVEPLPSVLEPDRDYTLQLTVTRNTRADNRPLVGGVQIRSGNRVLGSVFRFGAAPVGR